MKRNFKQSFTNFDGSTILVEDGGSQRPFILRDVALNALQSSDPSDRSLSAEAKIGRYNLALAIYRDDVVDVTAEQISMLKDLINRAYPSPGIVAQSYSMLETDYAGA